MAVELVWAKGALQATTLARMERLYSGPKPASGPRVRRTSARKRKTIRFTQLQRLIGTLRMGAADDRLLADVIACNIHLGLRPREIAASRVEGDVLRVQSAKTTNGRSIGTEREIVLPEVRFDGVGFVSATGKLVADLRARCAGSTEERVLEALSSRLARRCRQLRMRRACLYTTRHVGLSTAKQTMDLKAVAALAGHASTRTAARHYARHRSGLADIIKCARPTDAMVHRVQVSPNDTYRPVSATAVCIFEAAIATPKLTFELPSP